jgi:hypothetical protein
MKRANGELFWCHVTGRALDRQDPLAAASGRSKIYPEAARNSRADRARARDRRAAGRGQDQQADRQAAGISPRTVDIYRARLMKKYGAHTAVELVQRLVNH